MAVRREPTRERRQNSAIATRVRSVSRQLELTQDELGRLLNSSPRTVSRWATGDVSPHSATKQRLLELGYIAEQLSRVMQPQDANLWLFAPNRLLKGEPPADLIRQGEFRKVLGLIEALAEGVVV